METRSSQDQPTSQAEKDLSRNAKSSQPHTAPAEFPGERFSYLRLLFILVGSIFVAEVASMIVVYQLPNLGYELRAIIDAGITVILIFPLLYFLSFQPLMRHIEKRQRVEKTLQRANRALSVLSECNQILVRSDNETELLQKMCETIVNTGEYRMAWVGFAEQDESSSVRPAAQFGFEDGYLGSAQISWADNERGRGPTGTAIRERVTQVNQNFLTNPNMAPWRESALLRGYQSSIALPLQSEDSILGALTIYSASPDAFDAKEVSLLEEMANDLAFGIIALRVRAERNRAQQQVSEMSLFPILNPGAVLRVDSAGRVNMANQAAEQIGLCVGAQLADVIPALSDLDIASCIRTGTTQQVQETYLGECVLQWTVYGASELGLAFLYSTDITLRKRAEEEVKAREKEWHDTFDAISEFVSVHDKDFRILRANRALANLFGKAPQELVGKHCYELFHRSDRPWPNCPHAKAMDLRSAVTEEVEDPEIGCPLMVSVSPIMDRNNQVVAGVHIAKDISELKRAEEELERRNLELQILSKAEHRQRQLSEALVEAALILNKSLKLDEVLVLILGQIKEVIPYRLANIALLEGESFYDACHQGDLEWPALNSHFLLESFPLINKIHQSGKPILISDTDQEPNWVIAEDAEVIHSFLSAPLLIEEKAIGFVNLFSDQPGFFTQEMSNRLVAFAAHAAVAIQNAWLFEQVRASSERLQSLSRRLVEIQENERLYIARELHDEAGQMLTSLMLDLVTLETQANQPEAVLKKVVEMEEMLNAVSENLHNVAMALRPASLDHLGLVPALRQYVESVGERYKLRASFTAGNFQERLPGNMETELYRIVQEALTNVARHAHASQVDVILTMRNHKLVVMVEDDGNGFDPEQVPDTGHLGLFGMRERAEMIGGQLVIESKPGKGTTVMVEVDYDSPIVDRG